MKQFITLIAVFILLMSILIQIPLEMINHDNKIAIMYYVNNAKEKAKQEGYYTEGILKQLKKELSIKMKCDENSILIDDKTTTITKYRQNKYIKGENIYLKILVPFKNIIAADKFYKIDESNRYFVLENVTTSEKLGTKQ